METKNVLYAAVGAPVVAARKVSDQVNSLRGRVSKETANYTKAANKALDDWATEGEKLVSRISEGKVVEEISQKVDLDQAKEQVGKLRDQLEDMLATWRHSFRPEKVEADKPAAEKPAAEKPAAKKPAAKTSTAKTTKSSTATKTSTAKSTAPKAEAS
jgi:uncharacterized protein YdbL (DUF1318 family)